MTAEMDKRFQEQCELINKDFIHALKVNNEELMHDFRGAFSDRTQQQCRESIFWPHAS